MHLIRIVYKLGVSFNYNTFSILERLLNKYFITAKYALLPPFIFPQGGKVLFLPPGGRLGWG